jgi:hypothetical protein
VVDRVGVVGGAAVERLHSQLSLTSHSPVSRRGSVPNGSRAAWTDGQTAENVMDAAARCLGSSRLGGRGGPLQVKPRLTDPNEFFKEPVELAFLQTREVQC